MFFMARPGERSTYQMGAGLLELRQISINFAVESLIWRADIGIAWLTRARFRLPPSYDVGSRAGFLDAWNDERGLALRGAGRPKSGKARSRGKFWCGGAERYGESNFVPAMEVCAGRLEACNGRRGSRVDRIKRAIGWLIGVIGPRENAAGVAPAHGNSKAGDVDERSGS
jgi:hypothetical protein